MRFVGSSKALTLTLSWQPGPPLCGLICAVSLEILNHHNLNFTSCRFSSLAPAAANTLFTFIGKWTETKMALAREIWHTTL